MSDTRELVWDCATADAATFTVDAPNVKLFTGFPKGRTFDLGGVALKVGETKLGWATVSLVSHDATGFDRPGRILLAATGLSHNRGAKFTFAQDGVAMSCRGDDWSEGTMEWVTDGEANGIVAFTRTLGARKTLVAANLSATSVAFRPTGLSLKPDQRLSVDFGVSVASDGTVSFEPWGCMATAVNP